jgi:hypothetical protein
MNDLIEDVYLGIGELAVESQNYYLQPPYSKLITHEIAASVANNCYRAVFGGHLAPSKAWD